MKRYLVFLFAISVLFLACTDRDPNVTASGHDVLEDIVVAESLTDEEINYSDTFYIPIYSDIYTVRNKATSPLAATLSIRNTSLTDSIYIDLIDYYNTGGDLVRHYVESPLVLSPLQTIDYVIERDDDTGGTGANFIVALSAESPDVAPLIQAVMVGHSGQHGFAFTSDAVSLRNRIAKRK